MRGHRGPFAAVGGFAIDPLARELLAGAGPGHGTDTVLLGFDPVADIGGAVLGHQCAASVPRVGNKIAPVAIASAIPQVASAMALIVAKFPDIDVTWDSRQQTRNECEAMRRS